LEGDPVGKHQYSEFREKKDGVGEKTGVGFSPARTVDSGGTGTWNQELVMHQTAGRRNMPTKSPWRGGPRKSLAVVGRRTAYGEVSGK